MKTEEEDQIIEDPKRLYTPDEIFDRAKAYLEAHAGQQFRVSAFAMWTSYLSIKPAGYFEHNDWKACVEADAQQKHLQVTWAPDVIFFVIDTVLD